MGEIFDCLDVEACCSLSVITTLEFVEHHFAKVGHRLAPYDPTLSRTHHYCRHHARESVRREAAAFKRASRKPRLAQHSTARFLQADLNEAALRRTLSRARYQRCM